ncbi:MAG: hypothetical protein JWQ03_1543 [Variovorax sp.]|nr:hypothetical protein [Variovorax sp.]
MADQANGQTSNGIVSGGDANGKAALDFDDDEIYSGRSARVRSGGTTAAKGGDSGKLGPPAEQLSSSNGPSDPDGSAASPPSRPGSQS